ncbi:MAG: putative 5,10-methylenetetrahydromethanopterin reductase [Gammaproteobacteria bacterium]|jgi:probable non-F420 flavinoid oxidoreductase|nr:putative 5,10-methylenetetrahydromethanopterin reductase [Gammaproteobacteria bacterium]
MSALIGYHCSHECFSPSELLNFVSLAENYAFNCAMCSDHFLPWSENQAQSGFAWSWLGAAMQSTSFPFGIVSAPIERYHPAIIAQAAATLSELFPDRLWCAFGSGQWLNEHITGDPWPPKEERNDRLREAVEIIRALWRGETVTYKGNYFTVDEAKLYTLPKKAPLILGAALSKASAAFVAEWADGIITTSKPYDQQIEFIESFKAAGGEKKPMYLQAIHSYAESQEIALKNAWELWRYPALGNDLQSELKTPRLFDEASHFVEPQNLTDFIRISADLEQHTAWLQQDISLGFNQINIFNTGRNQIEFIEKFGSKVLPFLKC